MKSLMKTLFALAVGALCAAPALAQKGPSGVVLGVAGGLSKYDDSCEGVTTCDKTDRALRLNAGYGFGNGYVIEAVSFNFGKLKGSGSGVTAEIQAKAFGGGVAHHIPLGADTALFTRLGLAQVKVSAKASGFGISTSDSESQTALYLGVGFSWNLSPNTALELAWEGTKARYAGESQTVSAATVGVSFRF